MQVEHTEVQSARDDKHNGLHLTTHRHGQRAEGGLSRIALALGFRLRMYLEKWLLLRERPPQ
jgi:hypothetical protein